MAHLYKRGRQFSISYYVSGELVQKSLRTTNERIAAAKRKRLECDLALGDLHVASKTPLATILEAFCKELKATRTFKSYKNDFSRLRVFFGPVCESLLPGVPGAALGTKPTTILSQAGGVSWLRAGMTAGELTTGLPPSRSGPLASQTTVTDGAWHRVGFVRNGSDRILYVDDVEVARDVVTPPVSRTAGLYIGAGSTLAPGTFWEGLIDDVRIYDAAVTP